MDKLTSENTLTAIFHTLQRNIQQYPSLEIWWKNAVYNPTMKSFWYQLIGLIIVLAGAIYIRNWFAVFLCFSFIIVKIFNTISSMSSQLMHGFLITQICSSYERGIEDGKNGTTQQQNT